MRKKNGFVSLFASVQLALFLLFILAATSIIGTIIPQNQSHGFYVQQFGEKTAQFFGLLDIADMYNSWWFLSLLGLFALNLIVCSLERIPLVFRILGRDMGMTSPEQLAQMPMKHAYTRLSTVDAAEQEVMQFFRSLGFKAQKVEKDEGSLYVAQKGGWSRFGVYVVHCSILIVLLGAVIGSSTIAEKILHNPTFAFKGAMMLPEGQASGHINAFKGGQHIDLDFQLFCKDFTIEYYPNGMPKTYRTEVGIIEEGREVRHAIIEVNKPLTYKGVTFYQSSYQPFQNYLVQIKRAADGLATSSKIGVAREVLWSEAGVRYGIINRENRGEVTRQLKIWFSDGQGKASIFWLQPGQEAKIKRPDATYILKVEQAYATGLQATKDPGVGLVYSGCILMLVGLYVAFFLSHRRLYGSIQATGSECHILLAGDANKNKVGFERKFTERIKRLEQLS